MVHASAALRRTAIWRVIAVLAFALLVGVGAVGGGEPQLVHAQAPATPLVAGWNNVYYGGPPAPVATALASLGNDLAGVLIWDALAQRWHEYFPSASPPGDLQTMVTDQVYWIGVQSPATLPAAIASPVPMQLVPGWNNVVYLGPGVVGSSAIEQGVAWTWDALRQRWLLRDPSKLASSDFQTLSAQTVYWVDVPGGPASQPSVAPPPAPAALTSSGCYSFTTAQPALTDVESAISGVAADALHVDPSLEPVAEHSGVNGGSLQQPAYVPPTILRSIAWIETGWHQATWATQPGQSGPTITSDGCAYGVMQIASGMSIDSGTTPSLVQQLIASDFRANIEAGAQLLTKNWDIDQSVLPYFGRHDPHVLEDWYFAVWAYHCFGDSCSAYGAHDDPDDPSLPWPRPMYNSPQQLASSTSLTYADYPYEELVFGLANNPPTQGGHPLWSSVQLQLPPQGAVGFPEPHSVSEVSAHLENGTSLTPYVLGTPPTLNSATAGAPVVISSNPPQVITPQNTPKAGG